MKKSEITYNPFLTVSENAQNNHVSEASIRRYIRLNGIDRKRDNAIIIQRKVKEALKKSPLATPKELSSILGYSVNTIKKYLKQEISASSIDSGKLSTFDTSCKKFIISSVSSSQDEILNNILRLYVPSLKFECDLTYSVGAFYRRIPQPEKKFDKYPQTEDTLSLEKAYELPDNSISSIVVDLPFIICNNNERGTFPYGVKMISRFNYFRHPDELFEANRTMLDLAYGKLCEEGILVVKTMDVTWSGKQYWVSNFVINYALEKGFKLKDTFILTAKSKLLRTGKYIQKHARKFHSYFYVFEK